MRILISGSSDIWAIENHYCKHLNELGVKTFLFPAGNIFRKKYNTIGQKIIHKIYPKLILDEINNKLLDEISIINPDIVWVFKGMEIYPKTLLEIRKKGIFLINYNPDHPFSFAHKGSGNANVKNSLSIYHLHLSYSKNIINELAKIYSADVLFLPFGYDHTGNVYDFLPSEEINKIAFVGNPDANRTKILNNLASNGYSIDVFGNGWAKYVKAQNIKINDPIYGPELWETLQKYRIQLNIFRPHNLNSHNMRTFEVPSVGGIMLAPASEEHFQFFEDNKEAFFYRNEDELMKICEKILSLPKAEANKIRKAAHLRCIASKYSYLDRSEYLKSIFENYI
ncbi:MAG: glycosyltransferase family 1 protein [Flavobacterium sp.]|nr:MAG: glycosyltransferase family 1 protein [Flavobacterium sp.]